MSRLFSLVGAVIEQGDVLFPSNFFPHKGTDVEKSLCFDYSFLSPTFSTRSLGTPPRAFVSQACLLPVWFS